MIGMICLIDRCVLATPICILATTVFQGDEYDLLKVHMMIVMMMCLIDRGVSATPNCVSEALGHEQLSSAF